MQIRNRSQKTCEVNSWSIFTHSSSATSSSKQEKINFLLDEYKKELDPKLTSDAYQKAIRQRREIILANWDLIEKCQDEEFRNGILKNVEQGLSEILHSSGKASVKFQQIFDQLKIPSAKSHEPPSVITHFMKTIAWGGITAYAPVISTLLFAGNIISAAAQPSFTAYSGVPEGGKSICDGASHCAQGYVLETNNTETIIHQFTRVIQQVGGSMNLGALWAMKDCLTRGLVSHIALTTLQEVPGISSEILPTCNAQSGTLFGYRGSSTLTQVAKNTCDAFQNNFPAMTDKCLDTGKAIGLNIAISVMILAGLTALTCVIGCGFCLAKNADCRTLRRCC